MTSLQQTGQATTSLESIDAELPAKRSWYRDPMAYWIAAMGIALVTILLVLPAVVTTSPTAINVGQPMSPPSIEHWLGTDQLGRDVMARVLHGARISVAVATASALVAFVVAAVIGGLAATARPWLQEVCMRLVDVGLAFPGILLPLVLAAVIGPSMATTVIALGILFSFPMARVVRSAIYAEYGYDYVTAARMLGMGRLRLVGYHIGINAMVPVLVYTTLVMASAVLAEAALSFLGAGVPPPAPSWGNMINDGLTIVHSGAWWVSFFPGLAIVCSVLALNRFSEALGRRLRTR